MQEERFDIIDNETEERFGPFNRRVTYDRALARAYATGHNLVIVPEGKDSLYSVACVMEGRFLTEIEHDDEGMSIGAKPWFPDEIDEDTN